jgi:zinc finger BED domain-containing protein 1 (E3 SUMO-protein ligase ZBED1)
LTTDSWTSVCTENYIAVTAHYLTADFHSGSLLLECVKYSDHHTAENLCTELRWVISDWDIGKKVVAVVTDNAANITAAVRLAGLKHLPCFAHTLNLVVQKALKAIVTIKEKVKTIVEHFRRSTVAAEKFRSLQIQMRPGKETLKLKNDVVTRWNSTYYMCSRVCDVQEPLEAAIALLHNPVAPLTANEWTELREICRILKPFDTATREMIAEKSVAVSKVIVMSHGLITACEKIQTGLQTDTAKNLMKAVLEGLQKRFGSGESNLLLARATFLDPRFKKNGFSNDKPDSGYSAVLKDVTSAVTRFASMSCHPIQQQATSQSGKNRCDCL